MEICHLRDISYKEQFCIYRGESVLRVSGKGFIYYLVVITRCSRLSQTAAQPHSGSYDYTKSCATIQRRNEMSRQEKQQDKQDEYESDEAVSEIQVTKMLLEIVLLVLRIISALSK